MASCKDIALQYLNGFGTLDAEQMIGLRTPTAVQYFAPASLPPPDPKDNDAFKAHLASLSQILEAFPVTAKETIESREEKKVVIWATSQAKFKEEVKDDAIPDEEWDFKGEYVFMFHFDESGQKLERIVEFLDSRATEQLRKLIQAAFVKKKSGL